MTDTADMITPNAPRLELRAAGRTWHAVAGREWSIGRASEADIRLDNPRVSRQHQCWKPHLRDGFWST